MTIHAFGPYLVLFTTSGCWVGVGWGGGAPKGLVHNQLMQLFTLGSSKTRIFQNLFFLIW